MHGMGFLAPADMHVIPIEIYVNPRSSQILQKLKLYLMSPYHSYWNTLPVEAVHVYRKQVGLT